MSDMALEVRVDLPHDEAIELVTNALKAEGFGVLTRIDAHKTFKEKIDKDFRDYTILGACNPVLAHKALSSRPDAGLMLPCNVIVEKDGDGSLVRIIDPMKMMFAGGFADDPVLGEVGGEADARLRRVAKELGG